MDLNSKHTEEITKKNDEIKSLIRKKNEENDKNSKEIQRLKAE